MVVLHGEIDAPHRGVHEGVPRDPEMEDYDAVLVGG